MSHASASRNWRNDDNWRRNNNRRPNNNGNAINLENAFTTNLGTLFVTKHFADCIIVTHAGNARVPPANLVAHRLVLSCHSHRLLAYFSHPMTPMLNGPDGLPRPAWHPPPFWGDEHVFAMVDFFYTGQYQLPQMLSPVSFHIDMVYRAEGLEADWMCLYAFQQVVACSRTLGTGTWDPLVEEAIWRFINNQHREFRYGFEFKAYYRSLFDDLNHCWRAHKKGSLNFI